MSLIPSQPAPLQIPAMPVDSLLGAFNAVIDRIESVVAVETEALTQRMPIDIAATNQQKRQGLLELSRLMRAMPPAGPQDVARARLERLAAALDRNQEVLDVQLRAVRDVADIVAKVMRDAESDGTYTLRSGWQ